MKMTKILKNIYKKDNINDYVHVNKILNLLHMLGLGVNEERLRELRLFW